MKKVQLHNGELGMHPFSSGMVVRNDKEWIVVNTADGSTLIIEDVLNTRGENIVSKIKSGSKFYVPTKYLNFYKK